jgi:hypothetical protein
MSFSKIRYAALDGVATIELNDPPANTYSYDMMREIDAAVLEARMDRAVHVIVLRGAERAHGRRRPRSGDGRRSPDCEERRWPDRSAGSRARRPAWHRRDAAARAAKRNPDFTGR